MRAGQRSRVPARSVPGPSASCARTGSESASADHCAGVCNRRPAPERPENPGCRPVQASRRLPIPRSPSQATRCEPYAGVQRKAGTNVTMAPSVSYSITVRLEVASRGRAVSEITHAVEQSGGVVTALDVTAGGHERLRVDVTCAARDTEHAEAIVAALAGIDGVTVHKVSDRTFLLHLGGKIEMRSKVPLRNRDDPSMAYTPGGGRVAIAIASNPEDPPPPTIHRNPLARATPPPPLPPLGHTPPYPR